jgi:Domain of unknown function (DUF4260)
MQMTHTHTISNSTRRAGYGLLTVLFLGAAAYELATNGAGWWQFFAFGAGPDIALFLGMGKNLEKGQLHPRAVPVYNALHRYWGPAALALLSIVLPAGYLVGALAWATHISLDRCVGYRLRNPDGFQRS